MRISKFRSSTFFCAFDAAGDHFALDGLALLHAQAGEPVLHPLAAELPHQVVFEGEVEAAAAGVALASAAAAELQVDAAGLVALAAQHVQAAHRGHLAALGLHLLALLNLVDEGVHLFGRHVKLGRVFGLQLRPGHRFRIAAEDDVGAAAGHVRGDGHGALAAGLGDDLGLALVVLGIEYLMRDAALFEHLGDQFAPLDGNRADEDRPPSAFHRFNLVAGNGLLLAILAVLEFDCVIGLAEDFAVQLLALCQFDDVPLGHLLDFLGDSVVFLPLAAEDDVGMVDPLHRAIRGDRDHVELVDLPELVGLGHGRAGHAADFLIELEEVLQGDRGQRLVLFLDADALLGLDGLVQAVAPVAARHEAPGELVDDHHLALVVDDVVHVALVEIVGLQGVVDQVRPFHVTGRVKALHASQMLGCANALVGEMCRVLLLVDLEVRVFLQLPRDAVGLRVPRHVVVRRPGDDERRAGLVDEDVVHLVDDGEVQGPLYLLHVLVVHRVVAGGQPHVVAEVVEAELVVRAVGDVAGVGLLPLGGIHLALDRAHGQAQRHVEPAHPLHVATGEVIVHGDDVYAPPFQGIEIGGQRGDERFALAGDHFGNVAAVEDDSPHELHVVVPQAQVPAAGLAADGEGLNQQVIDRFAAGQPLAEFGRLFRQLGVGHGLVFGLQGVDGIYRGLELADVPRVGRAEQPGQRPLDPAAQASEGVAQGVPYLREDFFHKRNFFPRGSLPIIIRGVKKRLKRHQIGGQSGSLLCVFSFPPRYPPEN